VEEGARWILRANALYLVLAAVNGLWAGAGFIETHALVLIVAVLMYRAIDLRPWHVIAAATVALLGTSNLVYWELFVQTGAMAFGYVSTSLLWLFFSLEVLAAAAPRAMVSRHRLEAS
jgi:hypothetical protein